MKFGLALVEADAADVEHNFSFLEQKINEIDEDMDDGYG